MRNPANNNNAGIDIFLGETALKAAEGLTCIFAFFVHSLQSKGAKASEMDKPVYLVAPLSLVAPRSLCCPSLDAPLSRAAAPLALARERVRESLLAAPLSRALARRPSLSLAAPLSLSRTLARRPSLVMFPNAGRESTTCKKFGNPCSSPVELNGANRYGRSASSA